MTLRLLTICIIILFSCTAIGASINIPIFIPSGATAEVSRLYLNLIQRFQNDHPHINVSFKPTTNYNKLLRNVIERHKKGKINGVIVAEISELFTLKASNIVVPLEKFIYRAQKSNIPFLRSFYPEFLENSRDQNGRVYGLPFYRSTPIIYYNLDVLAKAGIHKKDLPKTWTELKVLLLHLKKVNGTPPLGFSGTWYDWIFEAFVRQNGGKLSELQNTRVMFDQPATIEALEFWHELSQLKLIQRIHDWKATLNSFVQRAQFPVMYYSVGGLETVRKKAKFAWTVGLMPINKSKLTPLGGANIFISSGMTKNEEDAAWKLIRFLLQPDVQIEISYATGYFPVLKRTLNDPIILRRNQLFQPYSVAYRQLFFGRAKVMTKNFMHIREILKEAIDSTLDNDVPPAQSLGLAQLKSQRWLE